MKRGSAISILGWVVFSDGLKEMFYTVDGEEYACEDVYRDRPDVVSACNYPAEYGIHAGFGLDSNHMGLLGLYLLDPGTYTVGIGARSNGGAEIILKTFTLEVIDETDPAIDIGTYIADSGVNLSGDFLPVSSNTYAVMQGSPVAIQGWAIFSDNLKEVYYTLDGEECACEDIYSDIPSDKINDYIFSLSKRSTFGSSHCEKYTHHKGSVGELYSSMGNSIYMLLKSSTTVSISPRLTPSSFISFSSPGRILSAFFFK